MGAAGFATGRPNYSKRTMTDFTPDEWRRHRKLKGHVLQHSRPAPARPWWKARHLSAINGAPAWSASWLRVRATAR